MSDFEVEASRAVKPYFYRAPWPGHEGFTPKEFQHAAVEYALRRDHCLIGDAPGVGKTAECILVGNAIEAEHTLVVCPASLRLNWEREVWAWSTVGGVTTYPVLKSKDGVSLSANYVIVSYNMLQNDGIREAICDYRWDHMIFDEAHKAKDFKGNVTTRIIGGNLAPLADRITFASGTILPNQPNEAYNAIRILDWDAIDRASQETFMDTYYGYGGGMIRAPHRVKDKKTGEMVWKTELHWSDHVQNQPINLADFQYRLRSRIMIRRLKEQVLHELPKKRWHLFPLALTPEIRRAMKHPGWLAAERLHDMDPDAFDTGIPVDGAISTMRRILGEAKMKPVADYIEDLLQEGAEKVVVGAWHKTVLDYMRGRLSKYGLTYMDGSTTTTKKQLAVDDFQGRDDVRIILGQKMPLGEGWTLTQAQDVVDVEPDWTPGRNDQLLERIHRHGQTGDYVIGHMPVVPGTLDEKIVGTSVDKAINIHAALDKED
jgi:SWI/SNF-related matrix-associated actin-dependent regulator 1 of chromatin subfamily A